MAPLINDAEGCSCCHCLHSNPRSGSFTLQPHIWFEAPSNTIGFYNTAIRSVVDPRIWQSVAYAHGTTKVYVGVFIPKYDSPSKVIYVVSSSAVTLTEADFESLGALEGVLFKCSPCLQIDVGPVYKILPGQTLTLDGKTFTAITGSTNIATREFQVGSNAITNATNLMTCLTDPTYGLSHLRITRVNYRIVIYPGTNKSLNPHASVNGITESLLKTMKYLAPVSATAGSTVTINGITFTAHATTTTVANREFKISGTNSQDADELVTCVNDATYGVPNVHAINNAGTIAFINDLATTLTLTTSGTIGTIYTRDFGALLTLTDVRPGDAVDIISIGASTETNCTAHATTTTLASAQYSISGDDAADAVELAAVINNFSSTLKCYAIAVENRVSICPYLPPASVEPYIYAYVEYHKFWIFERPWTIEEYREPTIISPGTDMGMAVVDGVVSQEQLAGSPYINAPDSVWCYPSYIPSGIVLLFSGWVDANITSAPTLAQRSAFNGIPLTLHFLSTSISGTRTTVNYGTAADVFYSHAPITSYIGGSPDAYPRNTIRWKISAKVIHATVGDGTANQIIITIIEETTSAPVGGAYRSFTEQTRFKYIASFDSADEPLKLNHWTVRRPLLSPTNPDTNIYDPYDTTYWPNGNLISCT